MSGISVHTCLLFFSFFLLSAFFIVLATDQPVDYPEMSIENDQIKLHLYLPDAEKGFYRGTRFDWSGMISRVDYQDHTFFGEWLTPHNPTNHDDVVGPCEEFGMQVPLGYPEAQVGETFIKIGIGHIEKVQEEEYGFWKAYHLVKPAQWTITHGDDWIEFQQELKDQRGWGYFYTKKIQIQTGEPAFAIEHRLKNIGSKTIETNFYNHNFVMIDEATIGKSYQMRFTFPARARRGLDQIAVIKDGVMIFEKNIEEKPLFSEIDGLKGTPEDGHIIIENLKTGGGLKIEGDKAPVKINFYAAKTAICPEPFLEMHLPPDSSFEWNLKYSFFEVSQ